jgi:hypothetical protein
MNSFPMKYSQAIPLLRQVLPPVLGIELKSLSILGKHFTIELHSQQGLHFKRGSIPRKDNEISCTEVIEISLVMITLETEGGGSQK